MAEKEDHGWYRKRKQNNTKCVIQSILGQNSIKTTEIYAQGKFKTIKNPLD
jgi:hypothetical protein